MFLVHKHTQLGWEGQASLQTPEQSALTGSTENKQGEVLMATAPAIDLSRESLRHIHSSTEAFRCALAAR